MVCEIYPVYSMESYRFVVVFSVHAGKLLLSRHRARETWETQGGHIEPGETPLEAARRELHEESGAVRFRIQPLFDYRAEDANGVVFVAAVEELGALPESEMAEARAFGALPGPGELTYPEITPALYARARPSLKELGLFGG